MSVPDENDEATNTNCLKGMTCPSCKSEGDFNIGVLGRALVSDDGIVDIEDADWNDDSSCDCRECTFRGKVSDFQESGDTHLQEELLDMLKAISARLDIASKETKRIRTYVCGAIHDDMKALIAKAEGE